MHVQPFIFTVKTERDFIGYHKIECAPEVHSVTDLFTFPQRFAITLNVGGHVHIQQTLECGVSLSVPGNSRV
jgi:hypothetical protein